MIVDDDTNDIDSVCTTRRMQVEECERIEVSVESVVDLVIPVPTTPSSAPLTPCTVPKKSCLVKSASRVSRKVAFDVEMTQSLSESICNEVSEPQVHMKKPKSAQFKAQKLLDCVVAASILAAEVAKAHEEDAAPQISWESASLSEPSRPSILPHVIEGWLDLDYAPKPVAFGASRVTLVDSNKIPSSSSTTPAFSLKALMIEDYVQSKAR